MSATWRAVGGIVAAFAAPRNDDEGEPVDADADALSSALGPGAAEHGDGQVIKLAEAAIREHRRTATVLVAPDRFHEQI